MKRGETLSATARAERSREATKAAIARELLYAGILARLWPAYLVDVENEAFPTLLCVTSPAGVLRWRLSADERELFEWLGDNEPNDGERPADRTATLMALASTADWEDLK